MVANSLRKCMYDLAITRWSGEGIVVVQSEYLPYIGHQCQLQKSWIIVFISNSGDDFFAGYFHFIYPQNSHLHPLCRELPIYREHESHVIQTSLYNPNNIMTDDIIH